MIPMELGDKHPIRKSKQQKQAFREDIRLFAQENGYAYREEKCSFGGQNLVLGDPEKAEYLVTAHYDTCARLPFPNLITPYSLLLFLGYQLLLTVLMLLPPAALFAVMVLLKLPEFAGLTAYLALILIVYLMLAGPANPINRNDNTSGVVTVLEMARSFPENQRDKVCFVLFDLEEAGLLGSVAYRKAHKKATDHQLLLNLDCVGDGDILALFPTKKLLKASSHMERIRGICGQVGSKQLFMREKGFSAYPSDQKNFPLGLGIAALRQGKHAVYLDRIHTPKDTVLEESNVNILRAALTSLITREDKR